MENKKKIIIVGGGTAGWITLAYLAVTVDADLTIVHSDEVNIIGVGESTTPIIKNVLLQLEVSHLIAGFSFKTIFPTQGKNPFLDSKGYCFDIN